MCGKSRASFDADCKDDIVMEAWSVTYVSGYVSVVTFAIMEFFS